MRREMTAQQKYLYRLKRRKLEIQALRVLLLLLLLGAWELTARLGILNDFIFSSPSRMAACLADMLKDGSILKHTGITLLETLVSFSLVMILGVSCAIGLWVSPVASAVMEPYLVMLNSLPKSALAPVLIVWLGANPATIIVAAISISVFGSMMTLYTGFRGTDPDLMKLVYTLGGGRRAVLTKVLLPGSIPALISNMKVNIGLCLVGVIIGEFLAAESGLGYLIIYGSQVFKMDWVMLSIVILCVMAMVLYQLVNLLERRCRRTEK